MRIACGCLLLVVCVGLFAGCQAPKPAGDRMVAVSTLVPAPDDFATKRIGTAQFPIPPYAKFLQGVKICLDPGHGGDAEKRGYKRGGTGVREAEVNLRVAKYLRELLTKSGAEVKLTREGDTDSSLAERAGVANEWGADIFVALHHNAIDNKPTVNHTTVWYHKDVDYRPSDLDLARYICQGLYDTLALPQITDVPLKSDQLMYKEGFGVLRAAKVTAALTETSFFTNPEEEQRLRQPEYNLKEAYGVYLGLARYAAGGLPRAKLVDPADGVVYLDADESDDEDTQESPADAEVARPSAVAAAAADAADAPFAALRDEEADEDDQAKEGDQDEPVEGYVPIVFELDDGLRGRKSWGAERQMILTDTIAVRIDGEIMPFDFENEGYRLTVGVPVDLEAGPHDVDVYFENMYKNSILSPHFKIEVRIGDRPEKE